MPELVLAGDRARLGEYLRELADLMGLRDWTIGIADDPPQGIPHDGHRVQGECTVSYGRKQAMIAVPNDWASEDADELRRIAAHELLHCHLQPVEWAFNNAANRLGFEAESVARDAWTDALEVAIDGMAVAWAERLPLPILKPEVNG